MIVIFFWGDNRYSEGHERTSVFTSRPPEAWGADTRTPYTRATIQTRPGAGGFCGDKKGNFLYFLTLILSVQTSGEWLNQSNIFGWLEAILLSRSKYNDALFLVI